MKICNEEQINLREGNNSTMVTCMYIYVLVYKWLFINHDNIKGLAFLEGINIASHLSYQSFEDHFMMRKLGPVGHEIII